MRQRDNRVGYRYFAHCPSIVTHKKTSLYIYVCMAYYIYILFDRLTSSSSFEEKHFSSYLCVVKFIWHFLSFHRPYRWIIQSCLIFTSPMCNLYHGLFVKSFHLNVFDRPNGENLENTKNLILIWCQNLSLQNLQNVAQILSQSYPISGNKSVQIIVCMWLKIKCNFILFLKNKFDKQKRELFMT